MNMNRGKTKRKKLQCYIKSKSLRPPLTLEESILGSMTILLLSSKNNKSKKENIEQQEPLSFTLWPFKQKYHLMHPFSLPIYGTNFKGSCKPLDYRQIKAEAAKENRGNFIQTWDKCSVTLNLNFKEELQKICMVSLQLYSFQITEAETLKEQMWILSSFVAVSLSSQCSLESLPSLSVSCSFHILLFVVEL